MERRMGKRSGRRRNNGGKKREKEKKRKGCTMVVVEDSVERGEGIGIWRDGESRKRRKKAWMKEDGGRIGRARVYSTAGAI